MSNDSNPINDTSDDLDSFEQEFYGTAKPVEEEDPSGSDDAEDTSIEEDALAPEAEDTDEPEGDDEPVEKPKGKQTAKERIQDLNTKYREAERRELEERRQRLELERRLAELERGQPNPAPEAKAPEPTAVGAPTPDDKNEDGTDKYPLGDFDPNYISDLTKHNVDKMFAEREAAQAQARTRAAEQAQAQEAVVAWEGRLQEVEAGAIPDIRDKASTIVSEFSNLDTAYGDYLANTIMSMDKGPEVLSYLADNISEAREIVNMGAQKATIALGRIEARFAAGDGNKPKPKVTKAPEPPRSVNRGNNGRFEVPDDTDDLEAFELKWNATKKRY